MVGPVSPCKVLRKVWPAVFTMVLKHHAIDSLELQVIALVFLTVRIPFSSQLSSQFSVCVLSWTKLESGIWEFCSAPKFLLQLYFELKNWKLFFLPFIFHKNVILLLFKILLCTTIFPHCSCPVMSYKPC